MVASYTRAAMIAESWMADVAGVAGRAAMARAQSAAASSSTATRERPRDSAGGSQTPPFPPTSSWQRLREGLFIWGASLIVILALSGLAGCAGHASPSLRPSSFVSPSPSPSLPRSGVLFADSFDRFDGPLGSPWVSTSSTWGIRSNKAKLLSGAYTSTSGTATIDVGQTDVTVSADITLSATPRRSNAGLTPGFVDYLNNLYCKIEVTEGNPNGLMSIGRRVDGMTTSQLAARKNAGFMAARTYHVVCARSGNIVTMMVGPREITYSLSPADLAAFGSTTTVGFRLHLAPDEDDGGSVYDNFEVTA